MWKLPLNYNSFLFSNMLVKTPKKDKLKRISFHNRRQILWA